MLTERVDVDPAAMLEAWVVERVARCDLDPFKLRVLATAKAGTPMAVMAGGWASAPPTTPTMPASARLWAEAPVSGNALRAGA